MWGSLARCRQGTAVDSLDYRDVQLARDDWLDYVRLLAAVEGSRARLLQNKIEFTVQVVPIAAGDEVVIALTHLDRVLLQQIDQDKLDGLLRPSTPAAAEPPEVIEARPPASSPSDR